MSVCVGGGGGLYVLDTQEITAMLWLLPVCTETRVGLMMNRPTVKVPVKVQREISYRVSGRKFCFGNRVCSKVTEAKKHR